MIPRSLFQKLWEWKDAPEMLFIIGPRQVGKTTLLQQIKKALEEQEYIPEDHIFWYNLEDPDLLRFCNESPKGILHDIGGIPKDGKKYLFFDEIQYLKDPSHFLKYLYDEGNGKLKIFISGSSSFYINEKFTDSLAGRKILFSLFSLSFSEFLAFKGKSIPEDFLKIPLFRKKEYLFLLEEYALFGGYPRVVLEESPEKKKKILEELVYSYLKKDVLEQNIRKRDEFYRFLKICAHSVGSLFNKHEIGKTIGVSSSAIENYSSIAEKTFFLSFLRPFAQSIRKELTKMPKVYFEDTGIRNFITGSFEPLENRIDKGHHFENLCFVIFREKFEELYFWRTQDDKEIDFILPREHLAIEAKWNIQKTGKNRHKEAFCTAYPEFLYREVSFEDLLEYGNSSNRS